MKKHYLAYLNLLLICSFFIFTSNTNAATFVVDITTDVDNGLGYTLGNGTNSLRKCIRLANANLNTPTVDIINFNGLTGGGPYTIQIGAVLGNLPVISEPVRLDGFTAGGAVAPTPIVVLRGAGAGPSPINNVFNIIAGGSNSMIRGFVIYKTLNDAIYNNGALNVTIEGCWVGILETGAAALTNNRVLGHGLYFTGGANNCSIGTITAKNVISSNVQHGIVCVGSSGINIKNNYVGTNTIGTAALGNGIHGINIDNCPNTIIGGALANEGNLISGNTQTGLIILNLSTNVNVFGNTIGTNLAGGLAIPNGVHGINVDNSNGAIIGGSNAGEANLVSGNTQSGIVITNASSNPVIKGNKIGTNVTGIAALGNGQVGLNIYNNVLNSIIGGALVGEGNLISGNGSHGVNIDVASHGASIKGNLIGTNAAGLASIPNAYHGINILASNNNIIGGGTKLQRNIISGNGILTAPVDYAKNGISVNTSTGNTIQGNFIGLGINGTTNVPNYSTGLSMSNSSVNTIGGANYLERNVISGNIGFGSYLDNVDNTTITQNYIGTDSTGTLDRGNGSHGISGTNGCNLIIWTNNIISGNGANGADLLTMTNNTFYGNYFGLSINGTTPIANTTIGFRLGVNSTTNTIGGPGAGQRNYFSGNGDHGMMIDILSTGNTVKGNYIGSNITGLIAVPNQKVGLLLIEDANNNIIGGTAANEKNLFCCSATSPGIQLNVSNGNTIQGNLIGTNINGVITPGFGNAGDGILLGSYWNFSAASSTNIIGGLAAGAKNIITNNGRDGVHLAVWGGSNGTNFNPIIGNSIYCNSGFGINMEANLGNENEGVPAPAVTTSNANTINGTGVNGNTIHVYRNQFTDGARCDCEGEIYVGTTVVAGGTWSLTHSLGLTAAEALSVTATQTNPTNSTSEFWVCAVPLPMDLLSLEAKKNNTGSVNVNFTVTNEKNINSYYILRSADGINFEMIGTVIPVNEFGTITSYSFEDNHPSAGTNYYRIQTVENDGRVSHSKIIVVNTSTTKTYLYPNPAGEAVTVVASGLITKVELLNALGQLVFEKTVSAAELLIPLSNFSTGVYYVKVYEGEFVGVYKLEHGL